MAINSIRHKLPEDKIQELMKKVQAQNSRKEQGVMRRAGLDLALFITILQKIGVKLGVDPQVIIADFLQNQPDALQETLCYYDLLMQAPELAVDLLKGFTGMIQQEQFYFHLKRESIPIEKLQKAVDRFKAQKQG